MPPRIRIYPPICTDSDKKIYCCELKHVCISNGVTEEIADKICPVRERYLRPVPKHFRDKLNTIINVKKKFTTQRDKR